MTSGEIAKKFDQIVEFSGVKIFGHASEIIRFQAECMFARLLRRRPHGTGY